MACSLISGWRLVPVILRRCHRFILVVSVPRLLMHVQISAIYHPPLYAGLL
jgi:hypothetical protein